ncbi:hypothetical protein BLNAU_5241 [Blattamonas nauphoetae]|uniref:Uncharacterized protein n=1 Tax=Blattamonas nauphoetae TaxID=2049346 RepID=A0ABQ9Y7P8_9EUKA|nr:hypothetical protein BLNAU_5241 [Blattamonas nauphoetae]
MVRTFDREASQRMSSISLLGVTLLSKTWTLPPLVGLLRPPTIVPSAPNSNYDDPSLDSGPGVSVVGAGLVFGSTSFSAGTGPLFSFGLAEEPLLAEVMHSIQVVTTLLGSSLVNVTSRNVEARREQLFGGGVSQRVVGCTIDQSTNHNSGTAMVDVNLGGNLRCVNTSFSDCRREGNADPPFINENITQTTIGRKIFDSSSTVTLISYSLCTFKDMTSADGVGNAGGSAIYVNKSSPSLSVKDCFFQNCKSTTNGDDGGAICILGLTDSDQSFLLVRSSFSECKSVGTASNYAGSVFVDRTRVTIADSFFEKSTAGCDGALTLYARTHSILFNCAFVLCSSEHFAGAVGIHFTTIFQFFFVQFRQCSSTYSPDARDVFLRQVSTSDVTSDMFTNCDSTSGSPNVYFETGPVSNSTFIPQIQKSSIPSISLSVKFNDLQELATVTVTASTAIGGTMGILLDGLIVPRLIHVTFGTETEPSQTGTAVVSSGPNGILPKADYTVLNYSISSSLVTPLILGCVCSPQDSDTIILVVDGWRFGEGNFVLFVQAGASSEVKEVRLNRLDKNTLHGTAPLYPSTAKGRLDWDTEYEVTKVVIEAVDNIGSIVPLQTLKFSTPKEPIRIEGADCWLGGSKEKAGVVEFWGVGLSSGKGYTLKVQKKSSSGVLSGVDIELVGTLTQSSGSESGRFCHTEEIFGVSPGRLSYGSNYSVVGIVVEGVEGVVNAKVGFSVADEPCRLTKMTGSEFKDAEKTRMELSFETRALSANTDYSMVVESIVGEGKTVHEKEIVLSTNSNGEIEPMSVKLYPREEEETKLKGQLEFGTQYCVKRIEKGSTEVHIETAGTTFWTPQEPIRIEGADCWLGGSKEKAGVVEFWGVGLSSGKGYTLKVQKKSSSGVLSGVDIELVGTLTQSSGSESGRFCHTEEIFGVSPGGISYGSNYSVVGIVVEGVEGVVNAKVGFSVADEPCRLTKMTGSEFKDAEKTRMELSFETRALSANTDYSMVVESIVGEGKTVHEKEIVLRTNSNGEIEPMSVKLYPREEEETKLKGQLEFGTQYCVKRIEKGSTEVHIETAGTTFWTPQEPIRIEGADCWLGGFSFECIRNEMTSLKRSTMVKLYNNFVRTQDSAVTETIRTKMG